MQKSLPAAGISGSAEAGAALQGNVRRPLIYLARSADEALVAHLRAGGWNVTVAQTVASAAAAIRSTGPAAGLVSFDSFPPREHVALEACLGQPAVGWVALTATHQVMGPAVRRLIRDYCLDYVTQPVPHERITQILGHALGMAALDGTDGPAAPGAAVAGDGMLGTCDAIQRLFRMVSRVAKTDASVFISGETGTGKELTALAIHQRSARRHAPFVAINCGAIPPHLLQSELFGYERGAFTGANARKTGRVEAANGGTLFLDEIGDMPSEAQAGLLRFLQEGQIERLGAQVPVSVDVRVISATHVNLEDAMGEGSFRADLFHRLCVLRINEPPLRERGNDIELLAHHFLHRFGTDSPHRIRGFTPAAIGAMLSYSWPGNVRELINRVRRGIVMAEGRRLTPADLELEAPPAGHGATLAEVREAAGRDAIEAALLRHRGRLREAADELGISRVTLYRIMTSYGMRGVVSAADESGGTCGAHLDGPLE
ncbi:sigma 54-interacting transcriptional regulator (plasmid) [Paraburkholderia sp. DD10]|uniref:sigma-54 dependent transcriptional regulator n=1 Tax=Paraburkholderia sp. DD10 TaxID=3409691 RepID=UPI003BA2206F